MQFKTLGCGGCIGGDQATTSFLVGDSVLIDAGTGLASLAQDDLNKIDHVFLSHSHMDHVALLPMLLDAALSKRDTPVRVYGIKETLDAISEHIFNWKISPDFRAIPSIENPAVVFCEITPGTPTTVAGCSISAIPVEHSIPAVAYHVKNGECSLVVATDMSGGDIFWKTVNTISNLRYLLIETAFQNARIDLCKCSGHLCPSLLDAELRNLKQPAEIFIVHMKPSAEPHIRQEIRDTASLPHVQFLTDGDIFDI